MDGRGFAIEYPELYKSLLQNELTTYFLAEVTLTLLDAIERRASQLCLLSQTELLEAQYYAFSILSFLEENQRLLRRKFKLAKSGLNFYKNVG